MTVSRPSAWHARIMRTAISPRFATKTRLIADTARAVEALGRRALVVGTDVTDPNACEHLATTAREELGRVDILLNNAGLATAVPALRETPEGHAARLPGRRPEVQARIDDGDEHQRDKRETRKPRCPTILSR